MRLVANIGTLNSFYFVVDVAVAVEFLFVQLDRDHGATQTSDSLHLAKGRKEGRREVKVASTDSACLVTAAISSILRSTEDMPPCVGGICDWVWT